MPTRFQEGEAPVVEFDPRVEISPFTLFRRLQQGRAPSLLDVREAPGLRTLAGAGRWPGPEWRPAPDEQVVLFDDDGSRAVALVRSLQAEGCARVRALFGGLDLYEFALDPQVVGEETFLRRSREP